MGHYRSSADQAPRWKEVDFSCSPSNQGETKAHTRHIGHEIAADNQATSGSAPYSFPSQLDTGTIRAQQKWRFASIVKWI